MILSKIDGLSDIILNITTFLSYADQLKLSHVNSKFRAIINHEFWARQIREQKYILWNTQMPRAKVFFANYFYHKGFGQDPKLPERIVAKVEDITLLPDVRSAKKALALEFPKGRINYRQAEHKKNMLQSSRITHTIEEDSAELAGICSNRYFGNKLYLL